MTGDDFESRLRSALNAPVTSDRTSDRMDVDAFLADVHHGARVRRLKRGGGMAVAGVFLLAGAGFAVNASGLLSGSQNSVAGQDRRLQSSPGTELAPTPGRTPAPSAPTQNTETPSENPGNGRSAGVTTATISPGGPIASHEVHALSLTATGTAHQWVLAKTPGRDCGRPKCSTLFATGTHGGTWQDLGQLPAAPAASDSPGADTISQVRFTKRNDTTYDGWAFGDSLWSTHNSGQTWSRAASPAGRVTALEPTSDTVYAGVTGPNPGDQARLYRSPTTVDRWTPVNVGFRLARVESVAAVFGVVAIIDDHGQSATLYVSANGQAWQPESGVCPSGSIPTALSTATDRAQKVGSLWVTCQGATAAYIMYEDTDRLGQWMSAQGSFSPGIVVGARTPLEGMAAGPGLTGVESVSSAAGPQAMSSGDVGAPTFLGFTNTRFGYLLNSGGQMFSTTDRGRTWQPYAVGDTTP